MSASLKTYYELTKPGIIYGNIVTTIGGFFLASKGEFDLGLFLATIFGIGFVIGSGCVFNNYIDRDIDKKMKRTKNRGLVTGVVVKQDVLAFGAFLGIIGFLLLFEFTNFLTLTIAALGFIFYVFIYAFFKRRSTLGTVVGSFSGAIPPVVGYTAAAAQFDTGALLLFFILVCWQMPHFYAIAMYRLPEYQAAGLPVLPVVKGMYITKVYILMYIVAFIIAVSMLTVLGYTGYTYLIVMFAISLAWLAKGLRGFNAKNDALWARKMFLFSLIVLMGFSIMISLESFLP